MSGAHDNGTTPRKRKLIEVALPLEAISKASKADKDRKVGTIKNIHKWFAPMPAPAWRALLFAATIDDPGDAARRTELLEIIEGLVPDNGTAPSEETLKKARAALAEQGGELPTVLDPFCGGGSTLVEAQRLGFPTVASDLNPVPALVTRIETQLVPRMVGKPAVTGPGQGFEGVEGDPLAGFLADVEHYARMVERQVREQVGHLYEPVKGGEVVAWLWARTVPCANPACAIPLPLYSSPWLSKQKDREAWLRPVPTDEGIRFEIGKGATQQIPNATKRDNRGGKFTCPACGTDVDEKYIRKSGLDGRMGLQLLAIALDDGTFGRRFVPEVTGSPAVNVQAPRDAPDLEFPAQALGFRIQAYGLKQHSDLYTPRQLHTLGAFADAVAKVPALVQRDGGNEDQATAIASVLAICVSKMAQANSSQTRWRLDSRNGAAKAEPGFGRQALPMLWDFAEVNPFGGSVGSWSAQVATVTAGLKALPRVPHPGVVRQVDARKAGSLVPAGSALVATDPPYFAQIPYADLSDYFYVWLRRAASGIHPDLFGTMATPKTDELIANPYRQGGQEKARQYFIDGFVEVFSSLNAASRPDLPMVVIYAHRQEESKDGEMASSAWDALLEAMITAGIGVVGTWPIHATNSTRQRGQSSNALASYIVMICRPREAAVSVDRRGFISALREELPGALRELQQSSIPAVDLAQAAIGPGMAVFSRFAKVTESDGSAMRVRDALVCINDELARVLSEQEGDFDTDTRWCVGWFKQYQWEQGPFGEAELLANALNTSVHGLEDAAVVKARAGKAVMLRPEELPVSYDPAADHRVSVWEMAMHLSRVLEGKGAGSGVDAAGALLARARVRIDGDAVKELAYLLYNICERNGWSDSARRFNNLVSSWPDLQTAASAAERQGAAPTQALLVFDTDKESDEEDLLF